MENKNSLIGLVVILAIAYFAWTSYKKTLAEKEAADAAAAGASSASSTDGAGDVPIYQMSAAKKAEILSFVGEVQHDMQKWDSSTPAIYRKLASYNDVELAFFRASFESNSVYKKGLIWWLQDCLRGADFPIPFLGKKTYTFKTYINQVLARLT